MHSLKIYYRPDNYPDWVFWREYANLTQIGAPGALSAGGIPSARPGFIPRMSFGKPQDDGDSLETGRSLRRGFHFQVRFKGTGHVVLDQFRVHAQKLIERSIAV